MTTEDKRDKYLEVAETYLQAFEKCLNVLKDTSDADKSRDDLDYEGKSKFKNISRMVFDTDNRLKRLGCNQEYRDLVLL